MDGGSFTRAHRDVLAVMVFGSVAFGATMGWRRAGIGEAEGDELDEAGKITVRQITALVPAEEAGGALIARERTRPAVLVGHQFAQVFAFGSRRHALGAPPPTWRVVRTPNAQRASTRSSLLQK